MLILYQLIIFITSGTSSALAGRFTAEVAIPRKRAASAPEYLSLQLPHKISY